MTLKIKVLFVTLSITLYIEQVNYCYAECRGAIFTS